MNEKQAIINYSLNKFCPWIIVGFLLFGTLGFFRWEPYVIMGLIFFIDKFSHKVGYSVAYCEKHNLFDNHKENDDE
jgi:hypothetical protein